MIEPRVQVWKDGDKYFVRLTPRTGEKAFQFEVAKSGVAAMLRNWLKTGFTVAIEKPADLTGTMIYDISEYT